MSLRQCLILTINVIVPYTHKAMKSVVRLICPCTEDSDLLGSYAVQFGK